MSVNNSSVQIESFTSENLESITVLQPDGWSDIFPSIQYYCQSDFCFPLKAIVDGQIVGIGTAIIHNETAWLAHIIVNPLYRNAGIGSNITNALIELCKKNSCHTLSLIATTLGEPVYKKLGFEVEATYIFFDQGTSISLESVPEIVPFQMQYEQALLQLDRSVSGEDRKKLLRDHVVAASLFVVNNVLEGFFMPTLGEGLIIANSPAAGLALMKQRAGLSKTFCLPVLNLQGANFLNEHGFTELRRASRMILGERVPWDGSKIYSRIGGNLG